MIRDELREQISDAICDVCLESEERVHGASCPYQRWGEEKCRVVKEATAKILVIPALAHLLHLAELAEQIDQEVQQ